MKRRIAFAALVILFATGALADAPVDGSEAWSPQAAVPEATSSPEPVFVAGIDTGGAAEAIQPVPGCRLTAFCVNDAQCRQLYPGFYACVWLENFTCEVNWCY